MMHKKYYPYLIGISAILVSFACGYYIKPDKVVTKTVTVEVVKTETDTKDRTIVVEVINKDGSKTITTKKDIDTNVKEMAKTNSNSQTLSVKRSSSLLVSVLGGVDITKPTGIIVGAHVSKQLLGPVHIGLFGLSSGVLGASVGLQF